MSKKYAEVNVVNGKTQALTEEQQNCDVLCVTIFEDEKDKRIADLEAKLAESEKSKEINIKERDKICLEMATDYNKQILELKQQLAEKEKEIEEVRSNHANLVANIAYKAVNVYTAESKKTGVPTFYKIHYSQLLEIEDMENLRNYAQDKISFAVEQLEKVRDDVHMLYTLGFLKIEQIDKAIDQQIKQLKEGK